MNTPSCSLQAFDPFSSLSRAITGLDPSPILQWLMQIRKRNLVMRLGKRRALCTTYHIIVAWELQLPCLCVMKSASPFVISFLSFRPPTDLQFISGAYSRSHLSVVYVVVSPIIHNIGEQEWKLFYISVLKEKCWNMWLVDLWHFAYRWNRQGGDPGGSGWQRALAIYQECSSSKFTARQTPSLILIGSRRPRWPQKSSAFVNLNIFL